MDKNHIHNKVCDEIVYPFPNLNSKLKFRDGYVIPSHTLRGMRSLIHVGIKFNTC